MADPRRPFVALLVVLGLAVAAERPAAATYGVADHVTAATLLVPFFEVGVDPGTRPQDTLLTVHNNDSVPRIVHVQVWDRDGGRTDLRSVHTVASKATLSLSMRNLISPAPLLSRAQVAEGPFYQGFVTIDALAAPPGSARPGDPSYPYFYGNILDGFVYFTNLEGGTVGGLTMVPIEAVPLGTTGSLTGFYTASDRREEIDPEARQCARNLVAVPSNDSCNVPSDTEATLRARYFKLASFNASTRVIVFAWDTGRKGDGGPSAICGDNPGLECPTTYAVRQYAENGTLEGVTSIQLNRAVTVISVPGVSAGTYEIREVPNADGLTQMYVFSINTGVPASGVPISAVFEGYVD